MDPTTIPPPSLQKSPPPPPQNPHSPTPIIDAPAFDCNQKDEPTTNTNMDNFKALVSKLAGRFLPAHQSHIERRLDDIFTPELLVPNHPTYPDMILTALWELNTEGGSSEEAISDFISKEYKELPWAHATILNHHLKDLCTKGKIVMTHDKHYQRCLSTPKPIISQPNLDNNSSSSPISSSSSSSSSDSHWSSPSSSSSSVDWDNSYQRREKRKRKRKGRKGKIVRVRVRGRGRDRGRGRGRGGQSRMKQVTSDTEMEVEEDDEGEEEQNQQQECNNEDVEKGSLVESQSQSQTKVVIGKKGNLKRMGESVVLRRSGRRRYVGGERKVGAKAENQEVIEIEDDAINGDGGEVECSKHEEEKIENNVECKEHEEQETVLNQEPNNPQEQCVEINNENLESCGQDLLKNKSMDEKSQHEEQETEVNKKESVVDVMDIDKQVDKNLEDEVSKNGNQEEVIKDVDEKDNEEQVEIQNQEIVKPKLKTKREKSSPRKEVLKVIVGLKAGESGSPKKNTPKKNKVLAKVRLQKEGTKVIGNDQPQKPLKEGTKEDVEKIVVEENEPQEPLKEGTKEDAEKIVVEKNQPEKPLKIGTKEDVVEKNQPQKLLEEGTNEDIEKIDVGKDQLQEPLKEGTKEDAEKIVVEKNQPEKPSEIGTKEDVEKIAVGRNQPQKLLEGTNEDVEKIVVGKNQPQKSLEEGTKEDDEKIAVEKNQPEKPLKEGTNEDVEKIIVEKNEPQKPLEEGKKEDVEKIDKKAAKKGLRSTFKKEEPTQITKKKLKNVAPVRRSSRFNTTIEQEAVINEEPDQPKEQIESSVRTTRSSKRISESCEVVQESKSKKTKRK